MTIINQNESFLSSNNTISTSLNNNSLSCIIDRNRLIKYASPMFQQQFFLKQSNNNNNSNRLSNNLNLFYELIKSMPELSNLEVR